MKNQSSSKKIVFLVLIIGFFTCAFSFTAEGASLTVDSDKATISADSVVVPLVLKTDGASISSINFTITYDNSRLNLASASTDPNAVDTPIVSIGTVGTSASKSIAINTVSASVTKVVLYGENANAISSGTIAELTFLIPDGASDGDASIALSSVVSASPTATNVVTTDVDGTVTLDMTGATITITSHADGDVVNLADITLEGTIDDLAIATVSINGTDVDVTDGAFSFDMTLSEGDNTITIVAVDGNNNESSSTLNITYLLGDVTGDGVIDNSDIAVVKEQLLGIEAFTEAADVNNDGIITALDLQIVINGAL